MAHLYCNQVHRCTSIETRYKEIVEFRNGDEQGWRKWQLPSAADECKALQLFADDLKDIYDLNHIIDQYDRPIEENVYISNSWSTVSKALVISRRTCSSF